MFKIRINRQMLAKNVVSQQRIFDALCENQVDWTHFLYLHRKSTLEYRLIFKRDHREIFVYKARLLYPFPFHDTYIVFRENIPGQHGYRNIYYNLKNGRIHYLNAYTTQKDETAILAGDFLFCLPSYWRFIPKLFFWFFKRRMNGLMDEDSEMIVERIRRQKADSPTCAPQIPEQYDLFDALFQEGILPDAHVTFDDVNDYPLQGVDVKDPGA